MLLTHATLFLVSVRSVRAMRLSFHLFAEHYCAIFLPIKPVGTGFWEPVHIFNMDSWE